VALRLGRLGVARVRPLAGGLDAWRRGGHPLAKLAPRPV
jgi:3-mercaptopyruvate sulfurtransferase SseA